MTNKINGRKSLTSLLMVLALAVMVMGTASAASHLAWVGGAKTGFSSVDDGVKAPLAERTDGQFVWQGSKDGFVFNDHGVKVTPAERTDGKLIWMGSKDGFEFATWSELKNNPNYRQVQ